MTTKQVRTADLVAARDHLRDMLNEGDTIFVVLRHRNSDGDSWWLDFYKIKNDDHGDYSLWLSPSMAKAGVGSFDERRECLKLRGGGMDMGAGAVMDLGRVLFDDNYALKGRWLA